MRFTIRGLAAVLLFGAFAGIAPAPPVPKKDAEEPPTPEQAKFAVNNLKQLGLAFHNYADAYGKFVDDVKDKAGKPILSWRVMLLPYMEEDGLFKQFKLDEPWDSESNKKLLAKIPKVYAPVRGKHDDGHTFVQGFNGEGELFGNKAGKLRFQNVTDGTSNTFMFVEAGESVPWTKPADIGVGPKKELPKLGKPFLGTFHAVLLDGSVRRFKPGTPEALIRALATVAGGEVTDPDKWTTPLKDPIEVVAPPQPPTATEKK